MRGAAIALLAGCSGKPSGDDPLVPSGVDTGTPTVDTSGVEPVPFVPSVTTTDNGDGTFTTVVSAYSEDEWVHVSLAAGGALVTADDDWDLAFRRELIGVNGGVSGGSDGVGAVLEGIDLASVRWAPLAGWFTDSEDADADGRPEGPFAGWFDYDLSTHILTPKDQVYAVRHGAGTWRMRLDDYYYEDRSGWPSFTWSAVEDGGPLALAADGLRVDATGADLVYVSLAEQLAVAPADGAQSDEWDVAFRGTEVATNGGASGIGERRAARVDGAFDAVTSVPDAGAFAEDQPDVDADGLPEYAVHDAWLVDPYTSAVTPAPYVTFVIERPDATHAKLSFSGYDDDLGAPGYPTFRLGEL